jgi:multiple sugar transport system substrate-binding protein
VSIGGDLPGPDAPLRRRQVLGLLAGGIVSAAAGCTLRGRGRATAEDEPSFEGEGPIVFAAPRDFSLGEQRRVAVRHWNDHHPTKRAVSVDLPFAADLQRADLIARLQARREDYDVLGLDVVWTAEFARGGYIAPLDAVAADLRLDRFLAPALDSARFQGTLWGVPLFSNAGLLYYRTDLVQQVPSTWSELADQAKELGGQHEIAGFVGQLARYEGLTVNLLEAIWGQGGDLLQADRKHLDVEAATRGLAFLDDGIDHGWIPVTARAYDEEQSRLAFQSGRAMFMRNWPYAYDLLGAEDSPVRKDFGVARLPGPSALGGANLAISRFSRHQRTALEFIRFLTTEAVQRRTFEDGGYPAVLSSIYEDPNVQRSQPYTLALRDSIRTARSRPSTPYYGQVTQVVQEAAFSVLHGENPDAAADDLKDSLPAALTGG